MSKVIVHKIPDLEFLANDYCGAALEGPEGRCLERKAPSPFLTEVREFFDKIREEAFAIFRKKGSAIGHELEDWLEAERELFCCPQSELIEKENQFELRVAAPGMEAGGIEISARPGSLVVKGRVTRRGEKNEGTVHFSEFSDKRLFRHLILPELIDVNKVSATLEEGVLHIVAQKAAAKSTAVGV